MNARTLEEQYASDPALLRLYKRKLLVQGWPGKLAPEEREYRRRVRGERMARGGFSLSEEAPQRAS